MSSQTPASNLRAISGARTGLPNINSTSVRARVLFRQIGLPLVVAALALGSYLLISHFFLEGVSVVGISMAPTLQNSQRYLLNRWVFYLRPPRPAEVVVLRDPGDNGFSVKRIIASGGDTVYLNDGAVYINGRKLDEPYLVPGTRTFAGAPGRDMLFKCAPDQFFVLGDNRNNSVDSRSYGPVPRGNILGLIIP
jgi:signal peptidase I